MSEQVQEAVAEAEAPQEPNHILDAAFELSGDDPGDRHEAPVLDPDDRSTGSLRTGSMG